ncbi:hypothetical protein GOB93_17815 [Acetobacter musti]|uniref:Mannosyltransferase n=1 Tax=Acetobacter musti TaxID=864732 RepID=A0ABX0JSL4_9PROT|nr:capsular polysaccharide synthesis protein [Acetobacter musti]NHN86476.1 hypothetical protein [Acetobacter musti]
MVGRKDFRLWKDAAKAVLYGIARRNIPVPEFSGWHETIATGRSARSYKIPAIVWFFWDREERPALVGATIRRVQELNPDYDVRVLTPATMGRFIDASFMDRRDITVAQKSDLIRLELLSRYGGIWCDATCFFSENFSWVRAAINDRSCELAGFYRDQDTADRRYPVIESWFLASPPDSLFMSEWRDEFRKILTLGSDEYFKELSNRSDYEQIRQGIERPQYLMIYLAAQIAMRKVSPALYLRRAEDGPFLYQQAVKWDREKIATLLCRLTGLRSVPPVIKLTHSNRYLLPFMIRYGLVRKGSILGQFLKS